MNVPNGYIGLCSFCVTNLNAANTPYIGPDQRGLAKDMLGTLIELPKVGKLQWNEGDFIPPGFGWMAGIFLFFGEGVDMRWPGTQERIPGWATTMLFGSLVCDWHNDRNLFPSQIPVRRW